MSLEVQGLEDLLNTVDDLGQVGNRIKASSLKKAMQPMLNQAKADAPKNTGNSAKYLRTTVKKYRNGDLQGRMGIDGTNWEKCKALWFQHWGYNNYGGRTKSFKGRVEKHVGWFDKTTNKTKNSVVDNFSREILSEIDKLLK